MKSIKLVLGDITKFSGDAIVNAANHSLMGGGGVDGAIHHAAGPELNNECARLKGCRTGEAKITRGYRLPVKYIIHTVGPIWHGLPTDAQDLKNCYLNAIKVAVQYHCNTVAFPSISTGAYGYPLVSAAQIAINTLRSISSSIQVTIVCFDQNTLNAYQNALAQ